MENDVSVIRRHHGRNQLHVSKGTPSFSQFQRAGGLYDKAQLQLVALDHCGAEITVELNPLVRGTQKAKEAVKLTGGSLGLKWTAASKKFNEVFTLLLLALPVPDSYHCCYRKDSLHSALAEDLL